MTLGAVLAGLAMLSTAVQAERGLGRFTPAQARVHARQRLITAPEALSKIRARQGARTPDVSRLPAHIEPFAKYMGRKASTPVSVRELTKAYVITLSSIRRKSRLPDSLCVTFPGYRELRAEAAARGDHVRPEDAMGLLLQLPEGQAYLNAAERGVFAEAEARTIVARMKCFGLDNTLLSGMRGAVAVGLDRGLAEKVRTASQVEWIGLVNSSRVPGIGAAKAGFFAALLGRGDTPTFDARELDLWRRYPGGREPRIADVLALDDRLRAVPMQLPPEYEPFRQHLVHHALWDAFPEKGAPPTQTTHAEVIEAMELAGLR